MFRKPFWTANGQASFLKFSRSTLKCPNENALVPVIRFSLTNPPMERRPTDARGKYVLPCASHGTVNVQVEVRGFDSESQGALREMDRSRMPRPWAVLAEFPYRHRPSSGRQPGRSSSCAGSRLKPRIESKNTDAAAATATNESSQLVVRRGSDFGKRQLRSQLH